MMRTGCILFIVLSFKCSPAPTWTFSEKYITLFLQILEVRRVVGGRFEVHSQSFQKKIPLT